MGDFPEFFLQSRRGHGPMESLLPDSAIPRFASGAGGIPAAGLASPVRLVNVREIS